MAKLQVIDPATEEPIDTVEAASPADAIDAVTRASAAFPSWAATPARERSNILRRAFELLVARREDFAATIVAENGKPITHARGEVLYAAEYLRWYSEEAVRLEGAVVAAPDGGGQILTLLQPVGVSVAVTPWNFPLAMLTRKLGPALAAGCTVVAKPAEATPLTALLLADVLVEAGVPDGVVELVVTDDAAGCVDAMLAQPAVRKLTFTGSTEIGRRLLRVASDRIVNCSMELGGNAPFVVFGDADLDAAIDGAIVAKFRHNAETCTAANRFLVETSVAAEFTARLAVAVSALRTGHGAFETTDIGPLIDSRARDRVEGLVQRAVDAGARVVTGGRRPAGVSRGFFYEPTVLADVESDAEIAMTEIFAPVAPVIEFGPDDDVVQLANAVDHGLVSYVYTADMSRALAFADRSEAGMVAVNKGIVSDAAAPFGGVKQSGLGREGGHGGLLAYCEQKYVAVSW